MAWWIWKQVDDDDDVNNGDGDGDGNDDDDDDGDHLSKTTKSTSFSSFITGLPGRW